MVEMLHPQSANRHLPGERSYSFRVQEETCGHTPGRKIEAFLFDTYYYEANLGIDGNDEAYKVGDPSSVTIDVYAPPGWQPTGSPTISGTPEVGEVLTVSHGLSGVTGYQWYRGSNPISGETGNTYRLLTDDRDHRLKVRVTFNNGTCYLESALTGVVSEQGSEWTSPFVTITRNSSSVTEGQSATFTLTASPTPATSITVDVDVSQNGDFISGSPGTRNDHHRYGSGQATLTVATNDDQIDEQNGSITAQVQR